MKMSWLDLNFTNVTLTCKNLEEIWVKQIILDGKKGKNVEPNFNVGLIWVNVAQIFHVGKTIKKNIFNKKDNSNNKRSAGFVALIAHVELIANASKMKNAWSKMSKKLLQQNNKRKMKNAAVDLTVNVAPNADVTLIINANVVSQKTIDN